MSPENIEYKNMLEACLVKGRLPLGVSLTNQPKDAIDMINYNKWCLHTYLQRLYHVKDKSEVLVLKLEDLKDQFFEKYYAASNREELVMAARMNAIEDVRKVTGGEFKYAANLYKLIKADREELLFTKRFSRRSYEVFKQYALIYDLIKFKVFLEELSDDIQPTYNHISFGLSSTQVTRLYQALRGIYIDSDTKLSNFQAVFNLNKIEKPQRVKWIHYASRNKNQLNKSSLFALIIHLNEIDGNIGKHLNPDIYSFITNSFETESGADLLNLKDAYRNYKKIKDPNSIITMKRIVDDIKNLKNKAPF